MNNLRVSRMESGQPEVFASIQGEGPTTGTPTVFLRLGICNLACSWCDTKYTWDWSSYSFSKRVMSMEISSVREIITSYGLRHLVVTGGEPLLQQNALADILQSIDDSDLYCEIETNGTLLPSKELINLISQWNVSIKLSNSHNELKLRERPSAIKSFVSLETSYFKFVIVQPTDIPEVLNLVDEYNIPADRVVLMPEGTTGKTINDRGKWISEICTTHGFRFSSRLHILLWGNKPGR